MDSQAGSAALPHPSELVTLVIRHRLDPHATRTYEAWLERAMAAAQEFPGHLGVNVMRPGPNDGGYTIVLRFASATQLQAWLDSARRRALIAEVAPMLLEPDQPEVRSGAAFWFTPPVAGTRPPRKWKQFLLTLAVIFPLTQVVPPLWRPVFAAAPFLGQRPIGELLVTATLVGLVVYLIMPALTRWLAGWLGR
jgi:antibiotic biosynthesis monooxygenase (ABM) superfamily enzyme